MKTKLLFITLILALAACHPTINLTKPEDYIIIDWSDVFKSFWSGMDHNYLYWDIDPTDWEAVYKEYEPKFASLGSTLYEPGHQEDATDYFLEMTKDLVDGHFALYLDTNMDGKIDSFIAPAYKRAYNAENGVSQLTDTNWSGIPDSIEPEIKNYHFFDNTIKNYLEDDLKYKHLDPNTGATRKEGVGHIRIDNTSDPNDYILYFYFSEFSFVPQTGTKTSDTIEKFMYDLCNDPNVKGVIMDVRSNGGGYNNDISFLLGPMLRENIMLGKTRMKAGDGRLQYTPWADYLVYPAPVEPINTYNLNVKRSPNAGNFPVVLIVNEHSVSCSELLAMAVQQMPNGYVVGRRTWGATGPRMSNIYNFHTNGGSFIGTSNSFWMQVVQAGWATQSANGENYEGVGVPPDEEVPLNWTRFYDDGSGNGRDDQLEAAIKHIDPKHIMP